MVRLARDERGATAIEYGLILALVFLAMIVGVTAFGQGAIAMWTGVAENIQEAREEG
ncbi:MAG TPA: Flp family type IVb pilin [Allosphingosinicella sp.]|jgi:pilus assembly protein Flp/PilA|nr:Flp family type IVb pilin [Allosphingosinicella sp.]